MARRGSGRGDGFRLRAAWACARLRALMNANVLIDSLLLYICLLIVITFHEAAHAWVAWKCGDDTARMQGRVSLNPIVHMDPVGTVLLPLLAFGLAAANSALAGFIIGWGRPVPVNPSNLRHRRVQDTLIALAGPGMNILLALGAVVLARLLLAGGAGSLAEIAVTLAQLSLFLCFFNLIPVPPLDGSHVLRHASGMTEELYLTIARYGFLILIVLIQFPIVQRLLHVCTIGTLNGMMALVGLA